MEVFLNLSIGIKNHQEGFLNPSSGIKKFWKEGYLNPSSGIMNP